MPYTTIFNNHNKIWYELISSFDTGRANTRQALTDMCNVQYCTTLQQLKKNFLNTNIKKIFMGFSDGHKS